MTKICAQVINHFVFMIVKFQTIELTITIYTYANIYSHKVDKTKNE